MTKETFKAAAFTVGVWLPPFWLPGVLFLLGVPRHHAAAGVWIGFLPLIALMFWAVITADRKDPHAERD